MIKMIPPVPTSAVMMPTPKQKIGFSIESIVGNDAAPSTNNQQTLTKSEAQTRHEIQSIINRLHNSSNNVHVTATNLSDSLNKTNFLKGSYSPPPVQTRLSPDNHISSVKSDRSPSLPPSSTIQSQTPPPPPLSSATLQQQQQQQPPQHQQQSGLSSHNKPPLVVPGMPAALVRPFPVSAPNIPDIKALPPYINTPEIVPPQHNPHLIAAAQFQMAAALQAGHVLGPGAGLHPHAPFLPNHTVPRDTYPLYPWLLSRHGRIFPHRFPGNFLLQPFRKPKRIRTAFSPSQLLKLEHAFESNQYVVGAERKALAQSLNLSETQVKVWFQNRRTKHKRMQQEDEKSPNNNNNNNGQQQNSSDKNNSSNNNTSCDEDDDELIDMEMDDCPSDEEIDTSPQHHHHHHLHQHLGHNHHYHHHHQHQQQQQQQQQHLQQHQQQQH